MNSNLFHNNNNNNNKVVLKKNANSNNSSGQKNVNKNQFKKQKPLIVNLFVEEDTRHNQKNINDSFRTFYFSPEKHSKITTNTIHFLISFEVEKQKQGFLMIFFENL